MTGPPAAPVGSTDTRLVVLRGNSGSGKSTIALALRHRYGHGCAVVQQDYLRRTLLRERDLPGGLTPALLDRTARLALDHDYHVVVEGILHAARYRGVLTALCADHRGRTGVYYLDVPLAETLRRHAGRPRATEFGAADMRRWYTPHDVLGLPTEEVIDQHSTLDESTERIWTAHLAGAPSPWPRHAAQEPQ